MRVIALISALVALALVLLYIVSETAIALLDLPLDRFVWRYFLGVTLIAWFAGWAWNRHHISELQLEVSAMKQEIRDVGKRVARTQASQ